MTRNALKEEWQCLASKIITKAEIYDPLQRQKIEVMALWDTGAERSAITQKVVSNLNLGTSGFIKVNSIHGSIPRVRVVKVRIKLQGIEITEIINPTVLGLIKGIDLVIGMDIIRLGDAAISNGLGKTLFTFAIPPFEDKVDLYKKSIVSPNCT